MNNNIELLSLEQLKDICVRENISSIPGVYVYVLLDDTKNTFLRDKGGVKGWKYVFYLRIKIGKSTYELSIKDIRRTKDSNSFGQTRSKLLGFVRAENEDYGTLERRIQSLFKDYNAKNFLQIRSQEQFFIPPCDNYIEGLDSVRNSFMSLYGKLTTQKLVYSPVVRNMIQQEVLKDCAFFKGSKVYLAELATGSGKTIVFYEIMFELIKQGKIPPDTKCAIISYDVGAQRSFIQDYEKFYKGRVQLIQDDDLEKIEPSKDLPILYLFSVQDLNNQEKTRWKNFDFTSIDFICNDEAHVAFYGDQYKNKTENLMKKILQHDPYTLWMTGTAANLKNNLITHYGVVPSYHFTLFDLLLNPEKVNANLPKLKIFSYNLASFEKYSKNGVSTDFAFNSKKLFEKENSKSLEKIVHDMITNENPESLGCAYKHNHIIVSVDEQKDAKSLKKVLERQLQENPIPIKLAFEETSLPEYQKWINKEDRSITITCNKWLQGVNVPQWDCLVLLNNVNTYEWIFQSIGRLLRVYDGKDVVSVYDVMQQRTIDIYLELAKSEKSSNTTLRYKLEKIYHLVPVVFRSDNCLKEIEPDFEDFYKKLQNIQELNPCYNPRVISTSQLNSEYFGSEYKNYNKKTIASSIEFNNNSDAKKGKITLRKVIEAMEEFNDNSKDTDEQKLQKILRKVNFNTERFLRHKGDIRNFQELESCDKDVFCDFVKIPLDKYIWLVDTGVLSREDVERQLELLFLGKTL